MVAVRNLDVEYGHYILRQTYENVLNKVLRLLRIMYFVGHPLYSHQNYGICWLVWWRER